MNRDWLTIDTAPRDGTVIETCRMIDGQAMFVGLSEWRTVHFSEMFISGMVVPAEVVTGWMRCNLDKRTPEPTHWRIPAG